MSTPAIVASWIAIVVLAFVVGFGVATRSGGKRGGRRLPPFKINMRDAIGLAIVLGFLAAAVVLFQVPIPSKNEQLLTYMLGQLSGFASAIVAYHYGQKAGDHELDRQRSENSGKLADAAKASAEAAKAATPMPPADIELKPGESKTVTADA